MVSIQQHSWSTAGTVAPGSQLCRLADACERPLSCLASFHAGLRAQCCLQPQVSSGSSTVRTQHFASFEHVAGCLFTILQIEADDVRPAISAG